MYNFKLSIIKKDFISDDISNQTRKYLIHLNFLDYLF